MAERTRRGNGEHSVKWVAEDGRWHGWISMGKRPDGTYDRRHLAVRPDSLGDKDIARAKRLLQGELKDLARVREAGVRRDLDVATVGQWLRVYLDTVAARKVRSSTWHRYDSLVRVHLTPLLGEIPLEKLEPEHVEAAYSRMEKSLSGSSVLQAHRVLSRALKVAVQRRRISRNVCTLMDAPSNADKKRAKPLSLEETQRLLRGIEGERNAARWLLALALGIRQGEALGLAWDSVDVEQGVIYIHRSLGREKGVGLVLGTVKSKSAVRALALDAPLLAAMKAHKRQQLADQLAAGPEWDNPAGLVFVQANGRPIDPRQDYKRWHQLLDEHGIARRGTHAARHTAASLLAKSGVHLAEAKQVMGHSQIALTADVYTHVDPEQSREALQKVTGALFPPHLSVATS